MPTFEEGSAISLREYDQKRADRLMEHELQPHAYYTAMVKGRGRSRLAAKLPSLVSDVTTEGGLTIAKVGMLDEDLQVVTEKLITITQGMFEKIAPRLEIHSYETKGRLMVVGAGYFIDFDDGMGASLDLIYEGIDELATV